MLGIYLSYISSIRMFASVGAHERTAGDFGGNYLVGHLQSLITPYEHPPLAVSLTLALSPSRFHILPAVGKSGPITPRSFTH